MAVEIRKVSMHISEIVGRRVLRGEDIAYLADRALQQELEQGPYFSLQVDERTMMVTKLYDVTEEEALPPMEPIDLEELWGEEAYYAPAYI